MNLQKILVNIIAISGLAMGVKDIKRQEEKKRENMENRIEVLSDHFQLLNHWLEIKNEGKSLVSYFKEMGYHHIAIYGMAELANRLSEDIAGSDIIIEYGIDRNISSTIARIAEIYSPDDDFPPVEMIVVTPYSSFASIKEILEKKVSCPIISLEEIVWSV